MPLHRSPLRRSVFACDITVLRALHAGRRSLSGTRRKPSCQWYEVLSEPVSSGVTSPSEEHCTPEDGRSVAQDEDCRATASESSPTQCLQGSLKARFHHRHLKSTACPKRACSGTIHSPDLCVAFGLKITGGDTWLLSGFTCPTAWLEYLQLPISLFCSHELVRGIYS